MTGRELPAQEMVEELQQLVLDYSQGKLKDDMAMLIVRPPKVDASRRRTAEKRRGLRAC